MPKLSIEIPDEIMSLIKADGYDLHSYFYLVFMRPLLERHQVNLEKEIISKAKVEIDTKIEAVKESVVVEVEKVEELPDMEPEPEPTPEPEPIEEPPVEEPPVEEDPIEPTPIEPEPEKN